MYNFEKFLENTKYNINVEDYQKIINDPDIPDFPEISDMDDAPFEFSKKDKLRILDLAYRLKNSNTEDFSAKAEKLAMFLFRARLHHNYWADLVIDGFEETEYISVKSSKTAKSATEAIGKTRGFSISSLIIFVLTKFFEYQGSYRSLFTDYKTIAKKLYEGDDYKYAYLNCLFVFKMVKDFMVDNIFNEISLKLVIESALIFFMNKNNRPLTNKKLELIKDLKPIQVKFNQYAIENYMDNERLNGFDNLFKELNLDLINLSYCIVYITKDETNTVIHIEKSKVLPLIRVVKKVFSSTTINDYYEIFDLFESDNIGKKEFETKIDIEIQNDWSLKFNKNEFDKRLADFKSYIRYLNYTSQFNKKEEFLKRNPDLRRLFL